jgi:hypothetical protein
MGERFLEATGQAAAWLTNALIIGRRDLGMAHVKLVAPYAAALSTRRVGGGSIAGGSAAQRPNRALSLHGSRGNALGAGSINEHTLYSGENFRGLTARGDQPYAAAGQISIRDRGTLKASRPTPHGSTSAAGLRDTPLSPSVQSAAAGGAVAAFGLAQRPNWVEVLGKSLPKGNPGSGVQSAQPRRVTITMQDAAISSPTRRPATSSLQRVDNSALDPTTSEATVGGRRDVPLADDLTAKHVQPRSIVQLPVAAGNSAASTQYPGAGRRLAPPGRAPVAQIQQSAVRQGHDVQLPAPLASGAVSSGLQMGATATAGAPEGPGASVSTERQTPTEGDVYLDGTLVGRWMARTLGRAAGRPASGGTAFDATRNRLPSGTMIGA